MKAVLTALIPILLVAVSVGVVAKLPATPPLEGAKAEEKKAKDAATAAAAAAQQAKAEDRAVAHYLQQQKAKGKVVTPQMPPNAGEMDAKAKEAAAKAAAVTAAITGAGVPTAAPTPAAAPSAAMPPVTVQQASSKQVAPKK